MKVFESSDMEALHDVGVSVEDNAETEPTNRQQHELHKDPPVKQQGSSFKINGAIDDGKMRVSRKEYVRITGVLHDFFECEQKFEKLEAIASYLGEQAKAAKEFLKECEEEKSMLFAELRKVCRGDSLSELTDSLVVDEPAEDNSQLANGDGIQAVASSPHDDAWRSIATSVLFTSPIKGCGEKKQQTIIDQCPTLGSFEDLRRRVGRDADSLNKLLPKGVGLELASELEERLLTAISKGAVVEKPEASEESEEQQIYDRVDYLAEKYVADTKIDRNNENFMAGHKAAEDSLPPSACPWTAGDQQDEWLTGWIVFNSVAETVEVVGDVTDEAELAALDEL